MSEELNQGPQTVDINALDATAGEAVDINTEADAFSAPPPPPDGDYLVSLALSEKDQVQQAQLKSGANKGKNYFTVNIVAKVIDGDYEGRVLFDRPNTIINQQGTCSIAGVLKALGETIPSRTTDVELVKQLLNVLQTEPTVKIKQRWEGSWKTGEVDANGREVYKRIRGMAKFPEAGTDADGNTVHLSTFVDEATGEEVQARGTITRYSPAD